jgi:hypothetical protein
VIRGHGAEAASDAEKDRQKAKGPQQQEASTNAIDD